MGASSPNARPPWPRPRRPIGPRSSAPSSRPSATTRYGWSGSAPAATATAPPAPGRATSAIRRRRGELSEFKGTVTASKRYLGMELRTLIAYLLILLLIGALLAVRVYSRSEEHTSELQS